MSKHRNLFYFTVALLILLTSAFILFLIHQSGAQVRTVRDFLKSEGIEVDIKTIRIVRRVCRRKHADFYFISSIGFVESRFDKDAVNKDDEEDKGLMQVRPYTAYRIHRGVIPRASIDEMLLDPKFNVSTAIDFIDYCYKTFGKVFEALWAYNKGPIPVAEKEVPASAHSYAIKVLNTYFRIKMFELEKRR